MTKFLNSTGLTRLISIIKKALSNKQDVLTFDNSPTANSNNPVKSSGIKTALDNKQDTLVSGTNIKTINNTSVLGSGNFNLTPRIEYASKTAMDADSTQQNGTIGYDRDGEIWYIYEQANGEWRQIDASGGGGNITLKTINNTSLIGSGNIELQPAKFVVTVTQRGPRYNFNKTYAEILAAYNTGADVELLEVSSNDVYKFSYYNEDDEIITFEKFSSMSTLCQWSVDSSDSWNYDDFTFQRVLVSQSTIKSINYTSLMGSGNISLQEPLVSGTNIKTINNESILGSGNISISGGSADLTNYYTKSEIDTMIGDVETILASI